MQTWERWLLGVSMALLNCALSSAGFTLQRKAHLDAAEEQKLNPEKEPQQNWSLLWLVGVTLYILAAVPDVIAYMLVPQVVCTTVACFRLVVVTVLAHYCLQEKAHSREVIGMMICSLGTGLCLRYSPMVSDEKVATSGQVYHPQVVTYVVVGLFFLSVLLLVEHADVLGCSSSGSGRARQCIVLPLATGLAFGLEKVFNTEIGFIDPPDCFDAVLHEPVWVLMLGSIAILGLTDFYLNLRGAKHLPVQVFVPSSFALATALQYFQSATIFREFEEMNTEEASLASLGAVLSLVGALCIQPPGFSWEDVCGPCSAEGEQEQPFSDLSNRKLVVDKLITSNCDLDDLEANSRTAPAESVKVMDLRNVALE
eukprot:TRINITY_DN110041_c0_g1_i1.p1 TRINITY_DN110041_c0_g1~~TRINITY_DN110041_c0_g1_i1.p1  ORF type:complete len:369 (+),score=42.34 TRINITY_DN110041_c0_g1_i1:159-1265(+)